MEILRSKVVAKLESWGNNKKEVELMVSAHFEQASRIYSNVNSIAEFIRTVY